MAVGDEVVFSAEEGSGEGRVAFATIGVTELFLAFFSFDCLTVGFGAGVEVV